MSKKQKVTLSNDFIEWITKQFGSIVKPALEEGQSWDDIIGNIIIQMDEALAGAEGMLKQMEAMVTAAESDAENEGRPND